MLVITEVGWGDHDMIPFSLIVFMFEIFHTEALDCLKYRLHTKCING